MAMTPVPSPPLLPWTDWQFWVVTVVALLAAAWIVRRMLPKRLLGGARRGAAKRATLTIGGRAVDAARPSGKSDCH